MKCIHHWACDPVSGPTSPARCLKCGQRAEFHNRLEYKQVHGTVKAMAPPPIVRRGRGMAHSTAQRLTQTVVVL